VRTVDRADVVQAEEPALEDVLVAGVLAVDPLGEVDQELVEDPAEEVDVAAAVDGEDLQRRPRVHRRIDIAEIPFLGRQRPVRMLVPLRHIMISWYLANAGSRWARVTQWKPRSQAANQGYSHLSGTEMMSNPFK
jgi:hypothetical protein